MSRELAQRLADLVAKGRLRGYILSRRSIEGPKLPFEEDPMVRSIAKNHENLGRPLLDIIQAGNMGLLKAADEFDPELDYPFSLCVALWARRAMRRVPPPPDPSLYPHNQIQ